MKRLIYLFTLAAIVFGACEKGTLVENTEYTIIKAGDPSYSFLRFINFTTGSPEINFSLNGERVSGGASTSGKQVGYLYLGVFPGTGGTYIPAKVGANTIAANIVSSATVDPGVEVYNNSINTEGGKYYSYFTTGTYNSTNKKIGSSFVLEEVKPVLDTTKVFVKLVHLGTGAPNVDFVLQSTGKKIISNVANGAGSNFTEVPLPGQNAVYLVSNAETGATIVQLAATALTKGRAYTFILRGVAGSTATPLGVSYYTSFY